MSIPMSEVPRGFVRLRRDGGKEVRFNIANIIGYAGVTNATLFMADGSFWSVEQSPAEVDELINLRDKYWKGK